MYLFVDSQCALYELMSSAPNDCDLVTKCLRLLSLFKNNDVHVHFTWVPSHVGIPLNEKADHLARMAILEPVDNPGADYTYSYVRAKLRSFVAATVDDQLASCYHAGSPSSIHYVHVSNLCTFPYGRHGALYDAVVMRLRLGYKYFWELTEADPVSCKLCNRLGGHTLSHYVLDCPLVSPYRPQGHFELPEMVSRLINNGAIFRIVKEYPHFAPRY